MSKTLVRQELHIARPSKPIELPEWLPATPRQIDIYDAVCKHPDKSEIYRNNPAVRAGIVTKVPRAPPSWERKKTSRARVIRLW